ncbi:MAG: hypothetical protein KBG25_04565 [Paludibacteraceae bacterium]|nr:hypothetical protein [Paludibacteraceae bacterium]
MLYIYCVNKMLCVMLGDRIAYKQLLAQGCHSKRLSLIESKGKLKHGKINNT